MPKDFISKVYVLSRLSYSDAGLKFVWRYGNPIEKNSGGENDSDYYIYINPEK